MPDIIVARLGPLVQVCRGILAQLTRLADLYELELQSVKGLTTRVTTATPQDLSDTAVDYSDPFLERMIAQIEAGGKTVTDEQRRTLQNALMSEDEE